MTIKEAQDFIIWMKEQNVSSFNYDNLSVIFGPRELSINPQEAFDLEKALAEVTDLTEDELYGYTLPPELEEELGDGENKDGK